VTVIWRMMPRNLFGMWVPKF